MAITAKKVAAGDVIKAEDHNALVDDLDAQDKKETTWGNIKNKPSTFAPATHTHAYTEITGTPTIPTVPGKMSAAEATAGTATTARAIDAKVLNDLIDAKIAAANAGGGE